MATNDSAGERAGDLNFAETCNREATPSKEGNRSRNCWSLVYWGAACCRVLLGQEIEAALVVGSFAAASRGRDSGPCRGRPPSHWQRPFRREHRELPRNIGAPSGKISRELGETFLWIARRAMATICLHMKPSCRRGGPGSRRVPYDTLHGDARAGAGGDPTTSPAGAAARARLASSAPSRRSFHRCPDWRF